MSMLGYLSIGFGRGAQRYGAMLEQRNMEDRRFGRTLALEKNRLDREDKRFQRQLDQQHTRYRVATEEAERQEKKADKRYDRSIDTQHRRDTLAAESDERNLKETRRVERSRAEERELTRRATAESARIGADRSAATKKEFEEFKTSLKRPGSGGITQEQYDKLFSEWNKLDPDIAPKKGGTFEGYVTDYVTNRRKFFKDDPEQEGAQATGPQFRESSITGSLGQGFDMQQPIQPPTSGHAGLDYYNHSIMNPADTMPATGPDGMMPAHGKTSSENAVDLTPEVDPEFYIDPERNEQAEYATHLLAKFEYTGMLTDEERAWLEEWRNSPEVQQALGTAGAN